VRRRRSTKAYRCCAGVRPPELLTASVRGPREGEGGRCEHTTTADAICRHAAWVSLALLGQFILSSLTPPVLQPPSRGCGIQGRGGGAYTSAGGVAHVKWAIQLAVTAGMGCRCGGGGKRWRYASRPRLRNKEISVHSVCVFGISLVLVRRSSGLW